MNQLLVSISIKAEEDDALFKSEFQEIKSIWQSLKSLEMISRRQYKYIFSWKDLFSSVVSIQPFDFDLNESF